VLCVVLEALASHPGTDEGVRLTAWKLWTRMAPCGAVGRGGHGRLTRLAAPGSCMEAAILTFLVKELRESLGPTRLVALLSEASSQGVRALPSAYNPLMRPKRGMSKSVFLRTMRSRVGAEDQFYQLTYTGTEPPPLPTFHSIRGSMQPCLPCTTSMAFAVC